jgi:hypothetical protein
VLMGLPRSSDVPPTIYSSDMRIFHHRAISIRSSSHLLTEVGIDIAYICFEVPMVMLRTYPKKEVIYAFPG